MPDNQQLSEIISRIENRQSQVAVIGLGYVGLPLATEFANAGFKVCGLDISKEKVDSINAGENYIADVPDELLAELVQKGSLKATTDFSSLANYDAISICVPTPLSKTGDPDLSYILQALSEVKKYLRKGHIVVLESTTYPGTTEEVLQPELEESGLKAGEDFFLGFSPERIDPGNEIYGTHNTPKVIGGVTPNCTKIASLLYSQVIGKVVPVKSSRAAEMVKLLENTFRSINIGMVNELAIMCDLLKVDVWEVIDAAATKPFGYMPFYPGPGLGGHCIPIDPSYLSWKLRTLNYRARFIDMAVDINRGMPAYVVQKVANALNDHSKCVNGAQILVLGVSYKKDIDDIRESPALDIIKLLRQKGAVVNYYDPYIPQFSYDGIEMKSVELTSETVGEQDCTLIVTNHSSVDYNWVLENTKLIVDTRNALRNATENLDRIVKI
ncbi:UDP-N-acetyl-D-glucosamine dehydrogenase [candidate division LCP-89 bacterium B3_LCP]|uniref:UDP-N-acetyl-D-glucosamine dehydrogenase n=1 Tax=candidate division LCP-89 bacterium B3_LCP TaxID=2012998 RepID=A0A532V2X6_UNCL8|nr:MAG: UDP-N-acetyl-D-glucosamine dehydrogenase [candidate division LCP-89 bacterium B3_LCP]